MPERTGRAQENLIVIESSKNSTAPKDVPGAPVKRQYHSPRLEEFGDVREITRTDNFGTGEDFDGSAFPVYLS
jgi:hypothetical protein